MGIRDLFKGSSRDRILVGDPAYDEWPVVREIGERETALAFRQQLEEAGINAVLTSDWELDRYGRGDIGLRVPPESYGDAEALLSGYDLD